MKFSAVVSTANIPLLNSQFNFIQLINSSRTVTVLNDAGCPYSKQTSGFVLDPAPDLNLYVQQPGNVFIVGYGGASVSAGSQNAQVPPANYTYGTAPAGIIPDSPYLSWLPLQAPWNTIKMTDAFQTYLVFRPDNGIWVALSRIDFSLNGPVGMNAQGSYDYLPALPGNPANPTPNAPGTKSGVSDVKFIEWTDSYHPDRPIQGLQPPDLGTWWMNQNRQPQLPPGSP